MCLSVCVCVCVCKILGKLRPLVAPTSYRQSSNYTSIKNNKRFLLKPFGYKVITIYITHGYCFQTGEDSWGHLDTSKHNYSCIMAIASKALHQSKQIWGSGCYNIKSTSSVTKSYYLPANISAHVIQAHDGCCFLQGRSFYSFREQRL